MSPNLIGRNLRLILLLLLLASQGIANAHEQNVGTRSTLTYAQSV